jgi:hypothetical protein
LDLEEFLKLDPKKVSGTLSVICGNEVKKHVEGSAKEMRKIMLSKMEETYEGMPWEEFINHINDSFLFNFTQIFKGRIKKEDETLELRAWTEGDCGALLLATGIDELKELVLHIQIETDDPIEFPWSGGKVTEPTQHLHTNTHDGLSYWLIKATLPAKSVTPWRRGDEIPWCYIPGFGRPMDVKLFDLIFRGVSQEDREIYKVVRENRN